MNDKKTLNIDPKIFSFSAKTTRKTREPKDTQSGAIKIKSSVPKKKNDSLKKKSILKMIRQHQEDRYNNLFEKDKSSHAITPPPLPENSSVDKFNKNFKEATLFFENLTEKTVQNNKLKNYTLKQSPSLPINAPPFYPTSSPIIENIKMEFPNGLQNIDNAPIKLAMPTYGCLKNGALPTYRNYMGSTQKQRPTITNIPTTMPTQPVNTDILIPITQPIVGGAKTHADSIDAQIARNVDRINTMRQTAAKIQELKPKTQPTFNKQKRTIRRTHKIGKSKVFPRVSVLVSNKTLRNNISTKTQLLKQTPMQDVKTYLMKRGFIKVGSTAPNDVLRKMYESATLICGELQNHNPENLLHNFLNGHE